METFDVIIIGGGSAGIAAAFAANALGASTALIDRGAVGGSCLNIGCVPTKNLLRAGEVVHLAGQKNLKSIRGGRGVSLSFQQALKDASEVVSSLRQRTYEAELKNMRHFFHVQGRASFSGPHRVEVDGRVFKGDKFIIATGSANKVPKIEGLNATGYLTAEDILRLKAPPGSLLVVGAGPLGLEFAQMFAHFGTRVRVIHRGPRILPRVEPEIAEAARGYMEDDGIVIHTDESLHSVVAEGGAKLVTVKAVGRDQKYRAEQVLIAVGRKPNTADLGLDRVGVALDDNGAVMVDDELATSADYIYAAGDVCGEPMLENVAVHEGRAAAANALGAERRQVDYEAIPACAFTHPEVGQVGLTESQAKERGHEAQTRLVGFSAVPRAQIMRDPRGLIKLVAEETTGRVLGCGAVGAAAGELINLAALAVKQKMTVEDLRDAIFAYPTMSEALVMAAAKFSRDPIIARLEREERRVA